jgi:hypothetical protein
MSQIAVLQERVCEKIKILDSNWVEVCLRLRIMNLYNLGFNFTFIDE